MSRTDPHKFALPQGYSYSQAETALAAVFGVDAEHRGPLKGRLKHLNGLGLPGSKVGRGVRITYSKEQVAQWLVALLIEEAGIDPTVAVNLIQASWAKFIWNGMQRALDREDAENKKGNHVFLTIQPRLMTGLWIKEKHPLNTAPTLAIFRHYGKTSKGRILNRMETFLDWSTQDRTWRCLRDLTADCEVLMASLEGDKS
jgi:hypothetical protein